MAFPSEMALQTSPLFYSLAHSPSSLSVRDVTLVCEDGREYCHSLILAASSSMWKEMLPPDLSHHIVLLPHVRLELLRPLIRFLYTGLATPASEKAGDIGSLLGAILPHLNLKVSNKSLTVEAQYVDPDTETRDMTGYLAVSQTDIMTSWAREFEEDYHESLPEDTQLIRSTSIEDKAEPDPLLINENIFQSGTMKKDDNKSCSVCGKVFLYPKDVKKHELVHQQTFPFCCKLCKKGVRNISNMYKHLRVKHLLTEDLKANILNANGNQYVDPKEVIAQNLATGSILPSFLDMEYVVAQGSKGFNKKGVSLYQCLVCDKLVTKYALKNHLSMHKGGNQYKCDRCPKSYSTNSAFSNHKVTCHQDLGGKTFNCSNCFKNFRSVRARDHHIISCHKKDSKKKIVFECRLCNKIFGYKNNLTSHHRTVHGLEGKKILEYNCKHCKETIKGKLKLSKHMITSHPEATGELCDLCGKSFTTEMKLLRHVSVHKTRERNLHCSFCPKKFFRKDILSVHEKIHTSPVVCKECGKKFPEERYLENHMLLHLEKNYDCMYCSKSFANQDLLKKHYEVHNDSLSHVCHFCLKRFQSKLDLKKHKTDHSSQFPLKCHVCHKGFLHDSQLEKHVDVVHSKAVKMLIFCQHCEDEHIIPCKEFSNLYSLKRHLARHKCSIAMKTNETCEICAKDPETYYKLKNHIRLNENKKVLPCDQCDKKFKTMQDLNTHRVVHTGQKPYSCHLCGVKFTQRCSLKTHYLRHKQGTVGLPTFQCTVCRKACRTYAALKSHQKSHQTGSPTLGSSRVLDFGPDVGESFPHIIFQSEAGLPLLGLDSNQQFQVTTINIGGEELETETEGELDSFIVEPTLVGMSRSGLGLVAGPGADYKIQIVDDPTISDQAEVD